MQTFRQALIIFYCVSIRLEDITVLIYQLVAMGTKKREAERLQREITELQEEIANGKDEIDLWLKKWKIEERARQKGYIYKNDDNG